VLLHPRALLYSLAPSYVQICTSGPNDATSMICFEFPFHEREPKSGSRTHTGLWSDKGVSR